MPSTYNPARTRTAAALNAIIIVAAVAGFAATAWLGRVMIGLLLEANAPLDRAFVLVIGASLLLLLAIIIAALYFIEEVLQRYAETVEGFEWIDRLKLGRKYARRAMIVVAVIVAIYMTPAV